MDKLNFYHQMRSDGGLRSGIDYNNERVLETYEAGKSPQDSALLWFIDVRCSAKKLPSEPESIRRWFLDRSGLIQPALHQLADDLRAGIDHDWPIKRPIPTKDRVEMAIFCSAVRRLIGRDISGVLFKLEKSWPNLVGRLDIYEHPVLAHG
jgi:hypothetical protein